MPLTRAFGIATPHLFHVTKGLELFDDLGLYIRVHCHGGVLRTLSRPGRSPLQNRVSLDIRWLKNLLRHASLEVFGNRKPQGIKQRRGDIEDRQGRYRSASAYSRSRGNEDALWAMRSGGLGPQLKDHI